MDQPNILLLHTDQQRWDALGANGNEDIYTPNLDRLAADGVNFERYFTQAPVCMPSRASYLTGQYPSQLGIFTNGISLPEETETLPRMLAPRGYHSTNIGKLHFQNHANRDHRERHPDYGFDHLEISDEPGTYRDAYRAWVKQVAPDQLDSVSTGPSPAHEEWCKLMDIDTGVKHLQEQPRAAVPYPADSDVTHTTFVAERTRDTIETRADSSDPFCIISGFYPPHIIPRADHPFMAPQQFLDLYDREAISLPEFPPGFDWKDVPFDKEQLRSCWHGYYAMVSEVDYHVGRILNTLYEQGETENTIIVFTSDHGEYLGEHGQFGKGFPGEDVVSRVPFIIRWPEGIELPNRSVNEIVEAVDLVPTLLDACGIQIPPHLQGNSLLPILENRTAEYEGHRSALIEGQGQTGPQAINVGRALRTDDYHYVMEPSGEEHLYDLTAEFGEYKDVSGKDEYATTLSNHRKRTLARINSAISPKRRNWLY